METYTTSDLNLAAALRANGHHICDLEPDKYKPNRMNFTFENVDSLPKLIMVFWNGTLEINIQKFILNRQLLKSLIYNQTQNGNPSHQNQTNIAQQRISNQ